MDSWVEISFCASSLRRSETSAKLREQPSVPANHRQSVEQNREQRGRQKNIDLALHAIVNLDDALAGLLFVLAVLHQQSRHGRAQRGLSFLQGKLDLLARFFFLAIVRESENAVDGIPELGEGSGEKRALLRSSAGRGESRFQTHRIVQISANPLELRRPRGQRIGLVTADHVAHGHGEQVEIVLDSQQLQRILAIAVHQFGLQFAQPGHLPRDIGRIRHYRGQRDEQAQQQA